MTDGRAADQGHAAAIVPHLRAGDLVIRDLGYFSLEALRQIATKQAWFLSRLSNTVAVYLSAEASEPALALVDHVQRQADQDAVVDLAVSLGAARLPCRLLAYRLPEEVVEQRRRRRMKRRGRKAAPPRKRICTGYSMGGISRMSAQRSGRQRWSPPSIAFAGKSNCCLSNGNPYCTCMCSRGPAPSASDVCSMGV